MRTLEAREVERVGREILAALSAQDYGTVRIVDGSVHVGVDATGDDALFVNVVLTDPPDGADTWPSSDIQALDRAFGDEIRAAGLDVYAYLGVRPGSEDDIGVDDGEATEA